MSSSQILSIDLTRLPQYQPRRFVPEKVNLQDPQDVKALYQKLADRPILSQSQLEGWINDRSELQAAIEQTGTILYIHMTCQTDDPPRAQAYKTFIETLLPVVNPLEDHLNKKYLEILKKFPLSNHRYDVYARAVEMDVKLFRQENVSLSTRVKLLCQEYQTLCGAMTVFFEGQERTLPQMGRYLLEPDLSIREESWRAMARRRLRDRDRLNELFDQMLSLRNQMGQNAGFENFRDYQFSLYHRFYYSPKECFLYHDAIANEVVPLWKDLLEKRRKHLHLEVLKPWDTSVDPLGRSPLKPFQKVEELIQGINRIFHHIEPDFGRQFQEMIEMGLLDLESRKGKAPGGYQSALEEVRKPFIFMNAVGVDDDVRTLLHEGGHAFHSLACAGDPLIDYRHGPMEFNEVASMGMEILGSEQLSVFYSPRDVNRSRFELFEGIIFILVWVATIDAFQHWIYENPQHTQQQREESWKEIYLRFGGQFLDWNGLEEELASLWHRQLHIFEAAFYYIEYGIAQLGALQLWGNTKKDAPSALKAYRKGLALGGSRPLPEIYATAGLTFDFSRETIAPLMNAVRREVNELWEKQDSNSLITKGFHMKRKISLILVIGVGVIFFLGALSGAESYFLASQDNVNRLKKDLLTGMVKVGVTTLGQIRRTYGDASAITDSDRKVTYDFGDIKLDFDKRLFLKEWGYDSFQKKAFSDEIDDLREDLEGGEIVGKYVSLKKITDDYGQPTEIKVGSRDGITIYYYGDIKLVFEPKVMLIGWQGKKLSDTASAAQGTLVQGKTSEK